MPNVDSTSVLGVFAWFGLMVYVSVLSERHSSQFPSVYGEIFPPYAEYEP